MSLSIQQWLMQAHQQLATITDASFEEAQELLCFALQKNTAFLITNYNDTISGTTLIKLQDMLKQRLGSKPLAYILGQTSFYGLEFIVNQHTLIPRNATESLIFFLLNKMPKIPLKAVDLGTGSGAIACTLAHHRPNWEIVATDIHQQTLETAKQNAEHLQLNNIHFLQSDWFSNLPDQYFDIIISNPPYIDIEDAGVTAEVKQHEPHHALFADNNGLADIEILLTEAKKHLNPNGILIIEHGHQQQATILQLAQDLQYANTKGYKDLSGKNRFIVAQ